MLIPRRFVERNEASEQVRMLWLVMSRLEIQWKTKTSGRQDERERVQESRRARSSVANIQ